MKRKTKDFNFRFISKWDDIQEAVNDVNALTEEDWSYFAVRQKTIVGHEHTKTVPLLFDWSRKTRHIEHRNYGLFTRHLSSISRLLSEQSGESVIKRANLVMLMAGKSIGTHTDVGEFLNSSRRIHIPIVTNPRCFFVVDGEERHLPVGELWEIDNTGKPHSVRNDGDENRIHLIIDVM